MNLKSLVTSVILGAAVAAGAHAAQRAPVTTVVDPEQEKFAEHNLDVGKQYYKRKAYAGAKDRLEEVLAGYPEYTKIDEVCFLLGQIYVKMDDPLHAREVFQKIVDERPDSPFAKKAREELDKLPKS
jgi:outer membrane protein assembly factor BamD (BamD/ComL family)